MAYIANERWSSGKTDSTDTEKAGHREQTLPYFIKCQFVLIYDFDHLFICVGYINVQFAHVICLFSCPCLTCLPSVMSGVLLISSLWCYWLPYHSSFVFVCSAIVQTIFMSCSFQLFSHISCLFTPFYHLCIVFIYYLYLHILYLHMWFGLCLRGRQVNFWSL